MSSVMEYKGYVGSVEFSEYDELLYGKVLGIRALISYEGETIHELIEDFHNAVDDYLILCEENGIAPERAYKGGFNVRMNPENHKRAAIYAINHNMSLNSFVEEAVVEKLSCEMEKEDKVKPVKYPQRAE